MKTRLTTLCLSLLLLFGPLGRAVVAQQPSADVEKATKVKSEVAKRVTNKKTRVKIKLRSGEELKGRITQADESRFTVTDEKTGKQTELTYTEVATVKGRGGLSTGWKIGIVAIAAVVVVGAVIAWGFTISILLSTEFFGSYESSRALRRIPGISLRVSL
ncbi:MAG: hypothetical protein ACREBG_30945 [Pyrinomonadaceae bacterium]